MEEKLKCEMCKSGDCQCDNKILYLHQKCHLGKMTRSVLNQEEGELAIFCSECDSIICVIKVDKLLNHIPPWVSKLMTSEGSSD